MREADSDVLNTSSVDEATARGLVPLTLTASADTVVPVGDGTCKLRYIEWLAAEQQRITQDGDRQAVIVDEGAGQVSLWVDDVVVSVR
jgi:hypothetical protein